MVDKSLSDPANTSQPGPWGNQSNMVHANMSTESRDQRKMDCSNPDATSGRAVNLRHRFCEHFVAHRSVLPCRESGILETKHKTSSVEVVALLNHGLHDREHLFGRTPLSSKVEATIFSGSSPSKSRKCFFAFASTDGIPISFSKLFARTGTSLSTSPIKFCYINSQPPAR